MNDVRLILEGEVISFPEAAQYLSLSSDRFTVTKLMDGGMGTCAQIVHESGKKYALKILHKDIFSNEQSRLRYIEELKTWLTVSACDGVVEALCVTRYNDIPCIISTWMEGGDMSRIVNTPNPMWFYTSMERIIRTLDWVYSKYHIIHRDLKPQNILLDKTGEAYIADWGLAKELNVTDGALSSSSSSIRYGNTNIEATKGFKGTICYASPEQIRGDKNIDFRTDIYSLGCIMYQWETGELPFMGKTWQEIARSNLFSNPRKIGGLFKKTNYRAEKIIEKCLQKNPKDRYSSYSDLIKDLLDVAKRQCGYNGKPIGERHVAVHVGRDEYRNVVGNGIKGKALLEGNYYLVDKGKLMPHLNEAVQLMGLGIYDKAFNILSGLFIQDVFAGAPDDGFVQHVTVNLANALHCLGRYQEAVNVLTTISKAQKLPCEYYLNLSNSYISLGQFEDCEKISSAGLTIFPKDTGLIGNRTIALSKLNRHKEAIESAMKRLNAETNVKSLCEAGVAFFNSAQANESIDFPEAMKDYKIALSTYRQAESINPRYFEASLNIANILFWLRRYEESSQKGLSIINNKCDGQSYSTCAYYQARNMLWLSSFQGCIDFCDRMLKSSPNFIALKRIRMQALTDGFVYGQYKDGKPVINKECLEYFETMCKDESLREYEDVEFLAKLYCWNQDVPSINKGLAHFEWGMQLYPNRWEFHYWLSRYLNFHRMYDGAIEVAEEGVKLFPWREKIHYVLADAYENVGRTTDSLREKEIADRIKKQKMQIYSDAKGW